MKLIKFIIIAVTLITILISTYFQIVAETYIKNQKQKYGIYINENRRNYKPFVVFYFEVVVFNNHESWEKIHNPYHEVHLSAGYFITPVYEKYLYYCYRK